MNEIEVFKKKQGQKKVNCLGRNSGCHVPQEQPPKEKINMPVLTLYILFILKERNVL